jgi:O-acetyl-ADP-ribose deacetylase (regulator of RNase III)
MGTKVSILIGDGLSYVQNVDALIVSVNNMLSLGVTKDGKEVNEADGGNLSLRLYDIRRRYTSQTGSIVIPETTPVVTPSDKFLCNCFIASILPNALSGDSRDSKVRGLYLSYLNVFTLAVSYGCKNIALPVLGTGSKSYDSSVLMFSLVSAIADFLRTSPQLKELCIVPRGRSEGQLLLNSFDSVSRTFGIDFWYLRRSLDLSDTKVDLMPEKYS